MTANRANWYETFESYVLFYPKLSATIALETMAAATRMIPGTSHAMGNTPAALGETKSSLPHASARSAKKRATSRKSANSRKTAKRSTGRRKAA